MRKLIKEQLDKLNYADLSHFDESTNTYVIPKYSKPHYVKGKSYIIQVAGRVIGNTTSVFATNWNRGTAPASEYLKAYIAEANGKMIYVNAISYDNINKKDIMQFWNGWLELDDVNQIAVL